MFIGREQELNTLNKLYRSDNLNLQLFTVVVEWEKLPSSANLQKAKTPFSLPALKPMQSKI